MSGICGIVGWAGEPVSEQWIAAMTRAAAYRGPDGVFSRVSGSAGFGYLSHQLTPESLTEEQPVVHNPTGVVVTADLRLDNRDELVDVLDSSGDSGDAALVLAAYLKWGDRFAEYLLGDFAIAVSDPRNAALYLTRDAMAMRSLYYSSDPRRVVFATEVSQILAAPGVERRLNEIAVATHLSGSHIPVGMSYYHGIDEVEPGEIVVASGGRLEQRRHWQLEPQARVRYRKERDYAERFRELYVEAVQCRLRSARPVGVSLSGGLDSGSVASVAGWLLQQGRARYTPEFRAYSWAFEELTQCDERTMSSIIAKRYGIPVTEISGDDQWPLRHYPAIGTGESHPYIFYYDELIDAVLQAAASEGTGLLMTGERGDALVGHWVYDYRGMLRALKPRALIRELGAHGAAMGLSTRSMLKRYVLKPVLLASMGRSAAGRAPRYPEYLVERFARSPALAAARAATMPDIGIADEARRRRYQLVFSAMSARCVEMLERGQAVRGVDHADPWSDRRLAEFVIGMPQYIVHRFGDQKRVARRGLSEMLTTELQEYADSTQKVNPTPLFERGIYDRARTVVDDLMNNSVAADMGFVKQGVLAEDRRRDMEGAPPRYDSWWFLTIEMWLRKYWT